MPVTDVRHDLDQRTLTITADFAAPVDRLWQVYADPRQLERIWGPPECPATFVKHELTPGGVMHYFMTDQSGQRYHGYWRITEVDQPRSFSFVDGFANEDFSADENLPESSNTFTFTEHDGGTQLVAVSSYQTAEALQQVLEMGVVEGASAAVNQIDALVA
ncbi:polyketide cyclase [Enemella dayhoffiae]|uniref:Polyketide cyclase n=1 Tax=Enemella dayhoffiae TaxID=2016507 RepID=A0A255HD39_9ACTN|nr:SRPBCC domain-containing protein [Enemella dayhoffiae]OYO25366.1 polyketide cyclase [Enemella dayhoffiae]